MGDEYTYTRVTVIGESDVDLRKEEFSDITFGEYIQNHKKLPKKPGVFCIKLRNGIAANGIVDIYHGNKPTQVNISCKSEDIVYIGKSSNIFNRVNRMFSSYKGANMVARKLNRIIPARDDKDIDADMLIPMPNITADQAKNLLEKVEFAYFIEENMVKRDFKKIRAVDEYMPCLNIGFEH